ncbi:hypothetical protein LguiB_021145 [Lonicera macranthoides]
MLQLRLQERTPIGLAIAFLLSCLSIADSSNPAYSNTRIFLLFSLIGVEHGSLAVEDSEHEITGRFGSRTVFTEKQVFSIGLSRLGHCSILPIRERGRVSIIVLKDPEAALRASVSETQTCLYYEGYLLSDSPPLKGVGFLRYFQLKQLPNFLLAFPILSLAVCSIIYYAKLRREVFLSLGFRASPVDKKSAAVFFSVGAESRSKSEFVLEKETTNIREEIASTRKGISLDKLKSLKDFSRDGKQ